MTLVRVRMQFNSSEVSFYTDLESFRGCSYEPGSPANRADSILSPLMGA